MPRAKGSPRPEGSGRKKGTPNKVKAAVREAVAGYLGRDAIEELCRRYQEEDEPAIAAGLLKEIVSYCYPKLKAVEHSAKEGEGAMAVIVQRVDLEERAKQLKGEK